MQAWRGICSARLQPAEEGELLLRQGGDDADGAVDGAEEQRGDARGLGVGQLHDQAAGAEAVHELAQVELPDRLRAHHIGFESHWCRPSALQDSMRAAGSAQKAHMALRDKNYLLILISVDMREGFTACSLLVHKTVCSRCGTAPALSSAKVSRRPALAQ